MGQLLKGGSPHGSSESDNGAQAGGSVPSASESDVKSASEKDTPGSPRETGFNPTSKK